MPSLEHNGLVDLFRNNPDLGAHLLTVAFGIPVPPHSKTTVVEATLDQLIPIEFRADLVIELGDGNGRVALAIVLEVQLGEDPVKKYSWPVYATVVRARKRCPTCVLVVTTNVDVARWAAEPIDIGLDRASFSPLVLAPSAVPKVTDSTVAEREREVAILSALAHGNDEADGLKILIASLAALGRFDPDTASVYLQIIYETLREPMRKALEIAIMEHVSNKEVTLPPFALKLISIGEERGETRGKREGKQDALLLLARRLGVSLSAEQRARIEACEDMATLDRWLDRVVDAKSADDLFA